MNQKEIENWLKKQAFVLELNTELYTGNVLEYNGKKAVLLKNALKALTKLQEKSLT